MVGIWLYIIYLTFFFEGTLPK